MSPSATKNGTTSACSSLSFPSPGPGLEEELSQHGWLWCSQSYQQPPGDKALQLAQRVSGNVAKWLHLPTCPQVSSNTGVPS